MQEVWICMYSCKNQINFGLESHIQPGFGHLYPLKIISEYQNYLTPCFLDHLQKIRLRLGTLKIKTFETRKKIQIRHKKLGRTRNSEIYIQYKINSDFGTSVITFLRYPVGYKRILIELLVDDSQQI